MRVDWGDALKQALDAGVGVAITYGLFSFGGGSAFAGAVTTFAVAVLFNAARAFTPLDIWGFVYRILPERVRTFLAWAKPTEADGDTDSDSPTA